jgi:hypothetical protein
MFSSAWSAILMVVMSFCMLVKAEDKVAPKDIPFDPEKIIYKAKHPTLGRIEVTCQERVVVPQKEIILRSNIQNGKSKKSSELFHVTNYNSCSNYKIKVGKDSNLIMVSNPGNRSDEPGATLTQVFAWKKDLRQFQPISKTIYSPFKDLQTRYRKILATAAIPKAEKFIIDNRKVVENYRSIDPQQTQAICEDFHNAYKTYADNLYKQKDYLKSFDIYVSLKLKFGDPQNIFYDQKNKDKAIVLVCQLENSNTDQSENQFYTFARRYLNKIEFVPSMLKRAETNIEINTTASKELATQILKFAAYVLKSAPIEYQLEQQPRLLEVWNLLIKDDPENPNYPRLLDEDAHLVMMLAYTHSCAVIPKTVIHRMDLKNDNKEMLNSMTLTPGDDYYNENLEKSAIFEYRQYVMGRALLKKCDDIPKRVFDRYFKFIKAQSYQN